MSASSESVTSTRADPPRSWEPVAFRDVVTEITSGDWGGDTNGTGLEASYVIRGTDFRSAELATVSDAPIRFVKSASLQARRLLPGDLLIELSGGSTDQPTGRALHISLELLDAAALPVTFSNFVKRVRVDRDRVDPEFVAQYWRFLYRSGRTRTYEKRTTGIRNFKLNDFLENESLVVPDLPYQFQVLRVLRELEQCERATTAVAKSVHDLKQAALKHFFSFGTARTDEVARVELRDTSLGPLPKHWTVAPLKDFAETSSGGTPSRLREDYYGGGIPWVKSGELKDLPIQTVSETLTPLGLSSSNAKLLPAGTLLIAMYGATAGKVAVLSIEAATNQAVCAIFPNKDRADATYLFYALMHRRKELLAERYGGAQPNISQTILRNFELPLPPPEEQREIARALRSIDLKVEAEAIRATALRGLFDALQVSLMRGEVRLQDSEIGAHG